MQGLSASMCGCLRLREDPRVCAEDRPVVSPDVASAAGASSFPGDLLGLLAAEEEVRRGGGKALQLSWKSLGSRWIIQGSC